MKWHHLILALIGLNVAVGIAYGDGTLLLREPDIHGDRIVFRYGGDLWSVSASGGDARRLTSSEGLESNPHFSPDGSSIAFTGQYEGRDDVYTMPSSGGEPERLTYHPMPDYAVDWSPDGSRILMSSGRAGLPRSIPRLWTISTEGGMAEQLPIYMAYDGAYSANGSKLAYVPVLPAFVAWRHYRGGRTTSVWVLDLETLDAREVPRENSNDFQPMWIGDDVYFLSDRAGTMNLFSYDGATVRQHTRFDAYDVKSAETDGKRIVLEQAGHLHVFDPATDESTQLNVQVEGDFPWARPHFKKLGAHIRSARLSPSGVRAVMEARGEIMTVPADKGDARNLTQSPGVHDRAPAWSPDGESIAWFSDEGGEYQLVIADQTGLEERRVIALEGSGFYYRPTWSPDSKKILFTDNDMNVWIVEVKSGKGTKVDTDLFDHPERSLNPVWSPDSKWIAYSRRLDNQLRAIFVYSLAKKESYQLTDGLSDAISPAFDANGKYLYFLASTDFALNIGWLDMTSYDRPVSRGLYLVVLNDEEKSPLLPKSDEEANEKEKEDEDGEKEDEKKKDKSVKVRIDLDGIDQRILAVDVPMRDYQGVKSGPEQAIFYTERIANEDGLHLHKYNFEDRESSVFLKGIGGYDISADGKKLLYRANGNWSIVETGGKEAKTGEGKLKTDALQARVDPAAEWAQMYLEAWRVMRDFFYDATLHGVDWPAAYAKYEPLLEHVRHRTDLRHVTELMLGEVVAGHTRTGGGDMPRPDFVPVGLLGADYAIENGRFRIQRIYTGENWNPNLRAPLSEPGIDVHEGDYVLAVNGKEIDGPNIYQYFEGTADRQTVIRVSSDADGKKARDVTVVPLRNEVALRQRAWLEDNRRKVDELSGGRLAYVYLPNTGTGGYRNFNRYYYGQQDRQGAVIDERFNGGGSVADYIVELMDRPLMSNWATRAGQPFTSPNAQLFGPKVLIVNEWAGSGGDYLPHAFRKRGIGPLIGKTTWGGLIGVYDYPILMDGATTTAPRVAIFNTDPDDPQWIVENVGVAPDIEVDILPADVAAGRDSQLERAVAECLRLLEENPHRKTPRPKPLNRMWK